VSDYIRARSPEQKQERMQAIMDAADKLFAAQPYHQITMGTIAQELGWSRSNLYKYAATQEEIFLALHAAKNQAWLDELAHALADAPLPPKKFAQTWAEVTERHGSFLRYQEILFAIIESNVTLERLTEFKRGYGQMTASIVDILARQCNTTKPVARELYLRLLFQAPALYNNFNCTPLVKQAMDQAGLPAPKGSFAKSYASFVLMCLNACTKA